MDLWTFNQIDPSVSGLPQCKLELSWSDEIWKPDQKFETTLLDTGPLWFAYCPWYIPKWLQTCLMGCKCSFKKITQTIP